MVAAATGTLGDVGNSRPSAPRILQLLPALGDGGVERSAVEMAEYLSARQLDNWVVSAGGPLVPHVEAAGGRHVTLDVGRKSPVALLSSAWSLARLIDAEKIDIVHARSRMPAWVALLALRLARRKPAFLTTFHGVYGHRNALKRFYNSAMLRGRAVIANSEFIRHHIAEVYGYPDSRIIVAPRGIDPALFDPALYSRQSRDAIRADLGGLPDGPLVVMVGRITGWKGHAVLIDAFARLAAKNARLAIVGGGVDTAVADLCQRIAALDLGDRVMLTGSRRDIPAILAASDLAISASTLPEAFGRAAIEAQAMEVPVVATAHGGSLETVMPGVTGWLVPPGDAPALAAAMTDAFSDRERLRAMGRAARAHVMDKFTTATMLDNEFSAYQRVLSPDTAH
ncbi:glycosyltransferase family 4 protein [Rhizobium sp. CG5]|uniref:glycosyltransferase family 4 protein n=1 Tax=Rhizobium sp. CG5 TaxID=2726076 RepID=UPI002033819F|nr:glycosyltransferase family 4 protein [Rhizobium sp. CG5]MCM2471871.1 glycosyltransferase family 4 protein [Rhizobium sp. CG5]